MAKARQTLQGLIIKLRLHSHATHTHASTHTHTHNTHTDTKTQTQTILLETAAVVALMATVKLRGAGAPEGLERS